MEILHAILANLGGTFEFAVSSVDKDVVDAFAGLCGTVVRFAHMSDAEFEEHVEKSQALA